MVSRAARWCPAQATADSGLREIARGSGAAAEAETLELVVSQNVALGDARDGDTGLLNAELQLSDRDLRKPPERVVTGK